MKVAAHLTGGAYVRVAPARAAAALATTALSVFGAGEAARASLHLPVLDEADFRVSCICCSPPQVLDRGFVCTTCLSVFCRADKGPCPCTKHMAAAMRAG